MTLENMLTHIGENPKALITLVRYVRIGELIVDGQYVAATPAAAELHGYDSVSSLMQHYLSETHVLEQYKTGKLMALARALGHKIPKDYCVEIQPPSQKPVPVRKHVYPFKDQLGTRYFFTKLELVKEPVGMPSIDIEALNLSPQVILDWGGLSTVAEVTRMLEERAATQDLIRQHITLTEHLLTSLNGLTTDGLLPHDKLKNQDVKRNFVLTDAKSDDESLPTGTVAIELNAPNSAMTKRDVQRKYLHCCYLCKGEWIGDERDPAECVYCRTRRWRDGKTQWERRRNGKAS
ncbi:MAG: hypothetical protein ETSY1_40405 [Candidatus Entotheonella factor]|uniref:Uncharacterized protein n=1 Tax=Entotheonella factor TaxID=1429438 RepID=W4L5J7_ENTF1|nr:MAG: hypothetical protein ETSY1_40405 [Candidatus Entotheonella factor]